VKPDSTDWARLAESLEALRAELARLGDRVAILEEAVATRSSELARAPGAEKPRSAAAAAPQPDGLDEELLSIISAAVAAFLGKRARIRQIQVLGHAAWAQQGRVSIQASHRLSAPHH
jgi:methylmalonyl-CoA carboxyltransferase large subunit